MRKDENVEIGCEASHKGRAISNPKEAKTNESWAQLRIVGDICDTELRSEKIGDTDEERAGRTKFSDDRQAHGLHGRTIGWSTGMRLPESRFLRSN